MVDTEHLLNSRQMASFAARETSGRMPRVVASVSYQKSS